MGGRTRDAGRAHQSGRQGAAARHERPHDVTPSVRGGQGEARVGKGQQAIRALRVQRGQGQHAMRVRGEDRGLRRSARRCADRPTSSESSTARTARRSGLFNKTDQFISVHTRRAIFGIIREKVKYTYLYQDRKNNNLSGEIIARDRADAYARLRSQGIRPYRVIGDDPWNWRPWAISAGYLVLSVALVALGIVAMSQARQLRELQMSEVEEEGLY